MKIKKIAKPVRMLYDIEKRLLTRGPKLRKRRGLKPLTCLTIHFAYLVYRGPIATMVLLRKK